MTTTRRGFLTGLAGTIIAEPAIPAHMLTGVGTGSSATDARAFIDAMPFPAR